MADYWLSPTPIEIEKPVSSVAALPLVKNGEIMNQNSDLNDDLRPEYDFSQMPIVQRGPGHKQPIITVQLEPDIAALFPNDVAVNEALRFLIRSMRLEELRIKKGTIGFHQILLEY